jgi:hypothetical protein
VFCTQHYVSGNKKKIEGWVRSLPPTDISIGFWQG